MKLLKYIIFPALIVVLVSCKEDVDNLKPNITLISPEDDQIIYLGSNIDFEAEFIDDVELASYKIDIHPNFDGHSHKSSYADSGEEFVFVGSWDFEPGQKQVQVKHSEITIPANAEPGMYDFLVFCLDKAGNETWVAIEIFIVDPDDNQPPTISLEKVPGEGQKFSTNDTIFLEGEVTDNTAIGEVLIVLMKHADHVDDEDVTPENAFAVMLHVDDFDEDHDHQDKSGSFVDDYDFYAELIVGQDHDHSHNPKTINWETGEFYILIRASDIFGNTIHSPRLNIEIE